MKLYVSNEQIGDIELLNNKLNKIKYTEGSIL